MNTAADLAKVVWNEAGMMELLGCTKKRLRRLTLEGDLPAVRLERGWFVYLASDVLKFLEKRKSTQGPIVSQPQDDETTP